MRFRPPPRRTQPALGLITFRVPVLSSSGRSAGVSATEHPSDRGWLKRVHFSHLADPGRPVGSDRQSHGQSEVWIRISCMLGASPSGLIHSVAVRYSQI